MSLLSKFKRKLNNKKGESIAETLISVLMISMCFIIICGAVVTSARLNANTRKMDVEFRTEGAEQLTGERKPVITITVQENGASFNLSSYYKGFETENGYFYYQRESGQ